MDRLIFPTFLAIEPARCLDELCGARVNVVFCTAISGSSDRLRAITYGTPMVRTLGMTSSDRKVWSQGEERCRGSPRGDSLFRPCGAALICRGGRVVRVPRISRLLKLITLLQTGTCCGAVELARQLRISRRTLFRDLECARLAGVPVAYDAARKRFAVDNGFFLPPMQFTQAEAFTTLLLLNKLGLQVGMADPQPLSDAAAKLFSALPEVFKQRLERSLDVIEVWLKPLSDTERIVPIFDRLLNACVQAEYLETRYESSSEGREIHTRIRPLRMVFSNQGWHLVGYSSDHKAHRAFKIERFVSIRQTGIKFKRLDSFDIRQHFGNAWYMDRGKHQFDVSIHFSSKVAAEVEEGCWHHTQRVQCLPDGSLRFTARVDGLEEILRWVLGYGKEAIVEQPIALRHLIVEHANAIRDTYAGQRTETVPREFEDCALKS